MKKAVIFLLVLFVVVLSSAQSPPLPTYYGTYIVSNGELLELPPEKADDLSGVGFINNAAVGLKQLNGMSNPWVNDPNASFIVYMQKFGLKPVVAKLTYKENVSLKNMMTGQNETKTAQMYMPEKYIQLRTAPIDGKQDALHLVPASPLENGIYVIDLTGRIKDNSAFAFAQESNAKKDVWTFVVSADGCIGRGSLSEIDLEAGEYVLPPPFGMYLIANSKYHQIPVHRNSDIVSFNLENGSYSGIIILSGESFTADELADFFVVFSEYDLRAGEKAPINLKYAPHRNMIPEKMFLEKLQPIEVDLRSKREVKKNKPPEITNAWLYEKSIPFEVSINGLDGRICKVKILEKLEPGKYAFHNGKLNGESLTYSLQNVVYSFEIK